MSDELYERLRETADRWGIGFAAHSTGVDIRLLRKLFTAEDARLWIHLTDCLELPAAVAERAGRNDVAQVAVELEELKDKGLTFVKRKNGNSYYCAVPFAHGLYEHSMKLMDRELAELYYEFFNSIDKQIQKGPVVERAMPIGVTLRTVPINRVIDSSGPVAAYDDAREIIKTKERIAVADCICAVVMDRIGKGCEADRPKEVCLHFGFYAENSVEQGIARWITREEALKILDETEAAGMIHQPANMEDPETMCNCCPDCCRELGVFRQFPNPAALIPSNFFTKTKTELCDGCGICTDRCVFGAITVNGAKTADTDVDKCIGCGLCVPVCPNEAREFVAKSEEAHQAPPEKTLFLKHSAEYEDMI